MGNYGNKFNKAGDSDVHAAKEKLGTSIIQVTARDADDPTYGNSARLVYAITHGQDYFSVDPQTGRPLVFKSPVHNATLELMVINARPAVSYELREQKLHAHTKTHCAHGPGQRRCGSRGAADRRARHGRESRDEYLVVLQAKDMGGHLGGLSGTTTVTVKLSDVNDNPPHFRRSAWSFSISELAAPGVEVGRLTASDPDLGENAQLQFTIMDSEEAQIFNISGREREAVIVLNKLLDYETRNSYTFSVEVANPVVDPRFMKKGPFKDQATSNNIRFSIDPQTDPEALFRIASDSGSISTVMELDREQEQWHNITVIATQRDNHNLVSRVVVAIETLDQNDNAPELDRQYSTSVCDSSAPGQVIQVLRAIDRDQEARTCLFTSAFPRSPALPSTSPSKSPEV
ncbi:hypothetical protein WMY93_031010 [Mugilogobius chulae]|uniref:Cadherin domain-containing protein n=1 Tax=Mugilogobius chulae TaxID=88201 RepID=A0AAW0MGM6_9GOBI